MQFKRLLRLQLLGSKIKLKTNASTNHDNLRIIVSQKHEHPCSSWITLPHKSISSKSSWWYKSKDKFFQRNSICFLWHTLLLLAQVKQRYAYGMLHNKMHLHAEQRLTKLSASWGSLATILINPSHYLNTTILSSLWIILLGILICLANRWTKKQNRKWDQRFLTSKNVSLSKVTTSVHKALQF